LSKQPQGPPQRSEQEIQEEEELQLALALSQSEEEAKEKEVGTPVVLFIICALHFCWCCVMKGIWSVAKPALKLELYSFSRSDNYSSAGTL